MPYSTELGMRVYDPSEGYNRGLQLGQFASRGMQSAMDERRTRMAEEEAALRRQMHMERAVALEAMNKEIRESMAADPKLTDEEARIKVFPKYAADILGENVGNYYAQLPYRQAQIEYAKARQAQALQPKLTGPVDEIDGLIKAKREAELAGDNERADAYDNALKKASGQQAGVFSMERNLNLLQGYLNDAETAKATGDMKGYERNMRLARYLESSRNAPEAAVRSAKLSKLRILDALLANPLSMLTKDQRVELEKERENIYSSLDEAEPISNGTEKPFVPGIGGTTKGKKLIWTRDKGVIEK